MNAVRISHEDRAIVITKKFAKLASEYNTPSYKELRKIKLDFPNYQVVVREVSKKTSADNKITMSTIERYIKMHDVDGKIMAEFEKKKNEKVGEKLHKTTFFQIKKWFFETYPELKNVA